MPRAPIDDRYRRALLQRTAAGMLLLGSGARNSLAQTTASPASTEEASSDLSNRLEALRKSSNLEGVWFRLERATAPPIDLAVGSAKAGESNPIASVSKSITGMAVALLIQQGRLSLDGRLDQVLGPYYQAKGRTLDPSLAAVTVERLLTHRAGLRTNWSSDSANGLSTGDVIRAGGGNRDFFEFVKFQDSDKSDGGSDFHYSNLSYLMLGMVVEAASGERYADFCQKNIFVPLGIKDANIPDSWRITSPFAGWWMPLADILRAWTAFDLEHPSILSVETLRKTLLGKLGAANDSAGQVFYTLGVNVRQNPVNQAYLVNHNGIGDFMSGQRFVYTFAEKYVPGLSWAIAFSPYGRQRVDSKGRNAINVQVREFLSGMTNGK